MSVAVCVSAVAVAAAVEKLAHWAFVGLSVEHMLTEAAFSFIDGLRDREINRSFLCTMEGH
jgi:hypothetical protein